MTGSKKGGAGLGSRRKEDFSSAAGVAAARRREQQQAQPAPRNNKSDLSIKFQDLDLQVLKNGTHISAHKDLKMEFVQGHDAKQWTIKITGHHVNFAPATIQFKACDLEQIALYPYQIKDPADNVFHCDDDDMIGMLTLKVYKEKLQAKLGTCPSRDSSFVLYFKPYNEFIACALALQSYLDLHHREFNNFTQIGDECRAQDYSRRLSEYRKEYLQGGKERPNGGHHQSKPVAEDEGSSDQRHYLLEPPPENSTSKDRCNGFGSGASKTGGRGYGSIKGGAQRVLRNEGGQRGEGHSDRNGARSSLYNRPIGRRSPPGAGSDVSSQAPASRYSMILHTRACSTSHPAF